MLLLLYLHLLINGGIDGLREDRWCRAQGYDRADFGMCSNETTICQQTVAGMRIALLSFNASQYQPNDEVEQNG
jgi:hypothetical protein